MVRTSWVPVLAVVAWAAAAPVSAQSASSGPRSVLDSVYSEPQADRGEVVFDDVCSSCHAASQFRGDTFSMNWTRRTLRDLYRLIRSSMPQDSPGRLSDQEYIDVVAYLLQLNRYPAGEAELAPDEDALRRIRIDDPSGN